MMIMTTMMINLGEDGCEIKIISMEGATPAKLWAGRQEYGFMGWKKTNPSIDRVLAAVS